MLAHISGIPVEESLPWLVPVGGFTSAALVSFVRTRLPRRFRGTGRSR